LIIVAHIAVGYRKPQFSMFLRGASISAQGLEIVLRPSRRAPTYVQSACAWIAMMRGKGLECLDIWIADVDEKLEMKLDAWKMMLMELVT
jgi:hypothetical protein